MAREIDLIGESAFPTLLCGILKDTKVGRLDKYTLLEYLNIKKVKRGQKLTTLMMHLNFLV